MDNYLIYKGIIERPNPLDSITTDNGSETGTREKPQVPVKPYIRGQNFTSEFLLAAVEILSYKIEMSHM